MADEPDDWAGAERRHREHRNHVRNLLVVAVLVVLAAVFIDLGALFVLVAIAPLILLEAWAARQTRPGS